MKTTKVALNLGQKSVLEKIEKARAIVQGMTGNPYFPTPAPALEAITTLANELEAAQLTAMGGGPDDTAMRNVKEHELDLALKALAAYVESVANGKPKEAEAIILNAGMEVKQRGPRLLEDFEVTITENPGELSVSKRHHTKPATFIVQTTTTPNEESSWTTIHMGTRGRFIKSGLVSGTRYYFRAAVVDKSGQGPWSDVKSAMAM